MTARLWFHPQRGAIVTDRPFNKGCYGYRGGEDGDWRDLGTWDPAHPPKGILAADPKNQVYGMGGPHDAYGPLERKCRDCGRDFVFTPEEQRRWYEELRLHVDVIAVRCRECRAARRRQADARRTYETARRVLERTPTPASFLAAAQAAIGLAEAGARVPFDDAVGWARRAGRPDLGERIRSLQRMLRP